MVSIRRSSLVASLAALAWAGSALGFDSFSVKLMSHPNGNASANPDSVDNRDYGLRLDNSRLHTFAFEDVTMTFEIPPDPRTSSTVYATVSGTIAHLQSSNGASVGYAGSSGLDALDQRWAIAGTFRLINGHGPSLLDNTLPSLDMLSRLLAEGVGDDAIGFDDFDLSLTPLFNEGMTPAIFNGPRSLVEKFGADPSPLMLKTRHRLKEEVFPSPEWDVVTGNGWVMAIDGTGTQYTRDMLFYTPEVPEPGTLGFMAFASLALFARRRA